MTRTIQVDVLALSREEAEALVDNALADPRPLLVTYYASFDIEPVRRRDSDEVHP